MARPFLVGARFVSGAHPNRMPQNLDAWAHPKLASPHVDVYRGAVGIGAGKGGEGQALRRQIVREQGLINLERLIAGRGLCLVARWGDGNEIEDGRGLRIERLA